MTERNYSNASLLVLSLMLAAICAISVWLVGVGGMVGDGAMGLALVMACLLIALAAQLAIVIPIHAILLRRANLSWWRPAATWAALSLAPVMLAVGWLAVSGAPSATTPEEEVTEIRLAPPG